ncbi:MAG: winged helix-turn-helix transcriptional regulator [Treponema sp.]|nr:winged helix-turn-helix transcriptional regulator [Treponema sp.]
MRANVASSMGIVCDVNLGIENGLEYIVIKVEPSKVPISYHGIFHYRSGTTKQELQGPALQNFILKKMGLSWDDTECMGASLDDIDRESVDFFLHRAIKYGRMPSDSLNDNTEKILTNLNLYDTNHKLKNAAVLLFGKRPSKFFSLCDFRIGRFGRSSADLMFQDSVEGDLIRMSDRVIDILRSKYLISPIHYEGLIRAEPLEIPEDALREVILNAIIHKDYMGPHIQMKVWNDRVEVWNKGSLPEDWTVETLLKDHDSEPRNRNIANVFYRAGFIENWGRGIDKIREGLKSRGLKDAVFEDFSNGMKVTIFRKTEFISSEGTGFDVVKSSTTEKTTEKDKNSTEKTTEKILLLMKENPKVTTAQLADKTGLSVDGINYNIKKLKKANQISRIGGDKGGFWNVL